MRTVDDIKSDIEFVTQDIKECKAHGYNTWAAQMDLEELMQELQQKERGLQTEVQTMTDLERRALLGDRQAQEECTRQGIVLPCPFCGGEAELIEEDGFYTVVCKDGSCISSDIQPEYGNAMVALADWNTRQAPPIGRCVECAKRKTSECEMYFSCNCGEQHTWETDNDFCSGFAPEDGEEDAEI